MSRDEAIEDRLIGELERAEARIAVLKARAEKAEKELRKLAPVPGPGQAVATFRTACGLEARELVAWPPQRYIIRAVPRRVPIIAEDGEDLANVPAYTERRFVIRDWNLEARTVVYIELGR